MIVERKKLNFWERLYLPAVIGKVLASYHGAYEGLFVRGDHVLTEGTTTSVFIVRDGIVWTAPEGGILPGITRRVVLDLAHANQLRVVERDILTTDLRLADEAFLVSSMIEIVPIVHVDDTALGSGAPGPVTTKLQKLYQQAVRDYVKATRRKWGDRRGPRGTR